MPRRHLRHNVRLPGACTKGAYRQFGQTHSDQFGQTHSDQFGQAHSENSSWPNALGPIWPNAFGSIWPKASNTQVLLLSLMCAEVKETFPSKTIARKCFKTKMKCNTVRKPNWMTATLRMFQKDLRATGQVFASAPRKKRETISRCICLRLSTSSAWCLPKSYLCTTTSIRTSSHSPSPAVASTRT